MAIIPENEYPANTEPASTSYPYGAARDDSDATSTDGTPLQEAWMNDWFGYQAALFEAANISPSGSPDTATASDALDALDVLFGREIISEVELDGDFDSGQTLICRKQGRHVEITPAATITHPSASDVFSGLGLVPEAFRPPAGQEVRDSFISGSGHTTIEVRDDGLFTVRHLNFDGTQRSTDTTVYVLSLSYNV